jgi:hypothetical protein
LTAKSPEFFEGFRSPLAARKNHRKHWQAQAFASSPLFVAISYIQDVVVKH